MQAWRQCAELTEPVDVEQPREMLVLQQWLARARNWQQRAAAFLDAPQVRELQARARSPPALAGTCHAYPLVY